MELVRPTLQGHTELALKACPISSHWLHPATYSPCGNKGWGRGLAAMHSLHIPQPLLPGTQDPDAIVRTGSIQLCQKKSGLIKNNVVKRAWKILFATLD